MKRGERSKNSIPEAPPDHVHCPACNRCNYSVQHQDLEKIIGRCATFGVLWRIDAQTWWAYVNPISGYQGTYVDMTQHHPKYD